MPLRNIVKMTKIVNLWWENHSRKKIPENPNKKTPAQVSC